MINGNLILPVTMLGIAFLCRSLQGLFLGTVRSRMNPERLASMERKQNAMTVFISSAALKFTQLIKTGNKTQTIIVDA